MPGNLSEEIMEFLRLLQSREVIYISNNTEACVLGEQIFDILKGKIL